MSSLPPNASVGDELDRHDVGVDSEHTADVVTVVPDALTARVHVEPASGVVSGRHGEARLRLEEGVLDALGLEDLVHGVGAGAEGGVDVAARVDAARQHVVLGAPHRDLGARLDRGQRIGDRRRTS